MREEYGFLCIGQAAGNIGSLFEEKVIMLFMSIPQRRI